MCCAGHACIGLVPRNVRRVEACLLGNYSVAVNESGQSLQSRFTLFVAEDSSSGVSSFVWSGLAIPTVNPYWVSFVATDDVTGCVMQQEVWKMLVHLCAGWRIV